MTVSYTGEFLSLLIRWKGSLWKSVWRQLAVFLGLYFAISVAYRVIMTESQRRQFEKIALYFDFATQHIPLMFVLGFYVSEIFGRWWRQFLAISWPDRFMMRCRSFMIARNEHSRMINRNISRYLNLTTVLAWRLMSVKILKRFPTTDHIERAGLFTKEERRIYEKIVAPNGKWFVPIVWISDLLGDCYREGIITDHQHCDLLSELEQFRAGSATLFCYNWIVCPLVYTQVVTIFVYFYFGLCLIGRQSLDPKQNLPNNSVDIYFPLFTAMQFLFYMGWLNVGEQLNDPFGEDDDDFEMNYILERNIQVGYMLADSVLWERAHLTHDVHWDQAEPAIPHTRASYKMRDKPFQGHLCDFKMSKTDMQIVEDTYTESSVVDALLDDKSI